MITKFRSYINVAPVLIIAFGTACGLLDVNDPTAVEESDIATPAGAELLRREAVKSLHIQISNAARYAGLRSDELFSVPSKTTLQTGSIVTDMILDFRMTDQTLAGSTSLAYRYASITRKATNYALEWYRKYGNASQRAHMGQMFAIHGIAISEMAEHLCPGFALHEIVDNSPVYHPPIRDLPEVYERALTYLDSALVYVDDHPTYLNITRVVKGRVLLALGRFDEAAQVVRDVPSSFEFKTEFSGIGASRNPFFFNRSATGNNISVSEREGGNGIDFVSANDPRVPLHPLGLAHDEVTELYAPLNYRNSLTDPIMVASGTEARLIEAEAALQTGGDWLGLLNALRTDGTFSTAPNPADPVMLDTVWNAGSGRVAGLAPLTDPGTAAARLDLVLRERAFWLFLTGRRLGDLRRLIGVYGRDPETVFPTGTTVVGIPYGTAMGIMFPLTGEEHAGTGVTGCVE